MPEPSDHASSAAAIDSPFVEICVDSLAGARAAVAGGADQIELCGALALGGLTPSAGLVEAVVALARPAGVTVRAMVRPRAGDFGYDTDDLAVAIAESRALVASGVDGLVFGATRGGRLDVDTLLAWRKVVSPPGFTLHRAIDTTIDPVTAVDDAIAAGADQILSSGGAVSAPAGAATLAAMLARADGRCRVVAGAGVRPDTVAALAAAGVRAVHGSARTLASAAMADDPFGFGTPSPPADARIVRGLRTSLEQAIIDTNKTNVEPVSQRGSAEKGAGA